MEETELKFGISVYKQYKGVWSFGFGLCFSHFSAGETYLYLNLFKWSIAVGKIYKGEN